MKFNEYKSADFWTELAKQHMEECDIHDNYDDEQMSICKVIGLLITGIAFFGLLFVACNLDSML